MSRVIQHTLMKAIIVDAVGVALWLFIGSLLHFPDALLWGGFLLIGMILGILAARAKLGRDRQALHTSNVPARPQND